MCSSDLRIRIKDVIDESVRVRLRPQYTALTLDNGSRVDAAVMSFAAALPEMSFGFASSDVTVMQVAAATSECASLSAGSICEGDSRSAHLKVAKKAQTFRFDPR